MNSIINFSKDLFTSIKEGFLSLLALCSIIAGLALLIHTLFIFVGLVDILRTHYEFSKIQSMSVMIFPLTWICMCIGYESSKISQTNKNVFILISLVFSIAIHILLFTTSTGKIYIRMFL